MTRPPDGGGGGGGGGRRSASALELDHVAGSRGDRDRARGPVLPLARRPDECAQRGERGALRPHRSRRSCRADWSCWTDWSCRSCGSCGTSRSGRPSRAGSAGLALWPGWACGTRRACRSWCPVLVPCHHALAGPALRRITDDPQELLLACRDRRRPGRGRRARGKCSAGAEHADGEHPDCDRACTHASSLRGCRSR